MSKDISNNYSLICDTFQMWVENKIKENPDFGKLHLIDAFFMWMDEVEEIIQDE